ncbi:MAG: hypothetical protein GY935_00235 [Gammaproteobacteria bacterium]|nr:hypothetical protein [Gammaproteobacteria bacterium]
MRDVILSGGPWTENEKQNIIHYCAEDVRITAEIFEHFQPKLLQNQTVLAQALFRGRYSKAVARIEWNGIPVDINLHTALCAHWGDIKLNLIKSIDRDIGVYEGTRFVTAKFIEWIGRKNIPWPKTLTGKPKLDDDTFRSQAKKYPEVAPLRELRHSLGQLRLAALSLGKDRRNRTSLMPFGSRTGRNQPSNSKSIFGASRWIRGLIKPGVARFVAYIDWKSQEIAIAAALSGDVNLWKAYSTGDPYMGFAIQADIA